jgi:hypothetical protein
MEYSQTCAPSFVENVAIGDMVPDQPTKKVFDYTNSTLVAVLRKDVPVRGRHQATGKSPDTSSLKP